MPDVPKFDETMSPTALVEFVHKVMSLLKDMRGSSDLQTISDIFKELDKCYFEMEPHYAVITKELMKRNYVSISATYIIKLHQIGYFTDNTTWSCTVYSLSCLWNYSDASKEIAREILRTKLPALFIENLINKSNVDDITSPNKNYLIKATINIIHNVVRHPCHANVFKTTELKKVLVNLIERNDSDNIGIVSMLILACLVDENELDLLTKGEKTIQVIIKNIRAAFESTSKRINGFSIWELVNGLRFISATDSMKKSFVKENGIQLMFDIIKDPSCEEDLNKCLSVLWNLCFDKEIRESLVNDFNIRDMIKPFQGHKSSKIRKCYEGIIWLIDNVAEQKQKSKGFESEKRRASIAEYKYDVFLSYAWANKSIVLQILDELTKSNIRVWIDINQMKGSTLEAMADGIENSKILVMAISAKYNTSPNCRTEAEYAFALRKTIIPIIVELKYRPMSWLGLIMGSKTYYEFSERRRFSESIQGLLNNIDEVLGIESNTIIQQPEQPVHIDTVDSNETDATHITGASYISQWSKREVQKWLQSNSLYNLANSLSFVDGKLLVSLINMNSKCPEYLYATLTKEFGIQLADTLRLNSAIGDLNL